MTRYATEHWENIIFSTVYSITERLGIKINLLPPMSYPEKMSVIISENCSENLNPVRCRQRLRCVWVCFAPRHWCGERGHKACPHPPFVPLLSWQNPITTQCSNNRLQIRGKKEERIITLKCHRGNLFLSTWHSRGQPQKKCVCVCRRVCAAAQWQ